MLPLRPSLEASSTLPCELLGRCRPAAPRRIVSAGLRPQSHGCGDLFLRLRRLSFGKSLLDLAKIPIMTAYECAIEHQKRNLRSSTQLLVAALNVKPLGSDHRKVIDTRESDNLRAQFKNLV